MPFYDRIIRDYKIYNTYTRHICTKKKRKERKTNIFVYYVNIFKSISHFCQGWVVTFSERWYTNPIYANIASLKCDFCKQCRPRTDAIECGVRSESTLFALSSGISIKDDNSKTNQTSLLLETDRSKDRLIRVYTVCHSSSYFKTQHWVINCT